MASSFDRSGHSGAPRPGMRMQRSLRALRSTKNLRSEKSARNLLQQQQKDISVRDENGNDVTPHPLVNAKASGPAAQKAQQYLAASERPELSRGQSQDKMNVSMSISASLREASMDHSKDSGGRSREGSFSFLEHSSLQASGFMSSSFSSQPDESYVDGEERRKTEPTGPSLGTALIEYMGEDEQDTSPVTEEQLNQSVYMQLRETSTIQLLDIPSQCVASDGPFAQIVKEKNMRYRELKESKKGSDKYVERAAQTFNYAPKHKEVQALPPKTVDVGTQAHFYEVYDETKGRSKDLMISGEISAVAPTKKSMRHSKSKSALTRAVRLLGASAATGMMGADEARKGGKLKFGLQTQQSTAALQDLISGQQKVDAQAGPDASFLSEDSAVLNDLMQESDMWLEEEEAASASFDGSRSRKHASSGEHMASRAARGAAAHGDKGAGKPQHGSKAGPRDLGRFPNLPNSLRLVERMVTQNLYHQRQLQYRAYDEERLGMDHAPSTESGVAAGGAGAGLAIRSGDQIGAIPSSSRASPGTEGRFQLPGASGKLLWTYFCDHTVGRQVTALAWNQANHDILSVGYGSVQQQTDAEKSQRELSDLHGLSNTEGGEAGPVTGGSGLAGAYVGADGYYPVSTLHTPNHGDLRIGAEPGSGGLVLCWSLKNPLYPERIIHTPSPVTTLDFSHTHPHLVAVGMYDGTIGVYDIRRTENQHQPVFQSVTSAGQHSDSVWEVSWVQDTKAGGYERFASVGTDGRVVLWSIKKGLEHQDLMTLKRVVNPAKPREMKSDAFIARHASGLCMSFKPDEPSLYLVGTETGTIHKCSTSYSEQYVENYFGHAGPVYRLRWSPYHHTRFLSASADWTVRLWRVDNSEAPVLAFPAFKDYVSDVCWSPQSAAVFACVAGNGTMEVWDLSASSHDPQVQVEVATPNYAALVAKQNERRQQLQAESAAGGSEGASKSGKGGAGGRGGRPPRGAEKSGRGAGASGGMRGAGMHGRRGLGDLGGRGDEAEEPEPEEAEKDDIATRLIPRKLTTCLFAHKAPVIVVGDDAGGVSVYSLQNMPAPVKSCSVLTEEKPSQETTQQQ